MAHIMPFKAVRPAEDKVKSFTSRSYETYSPEEKQQLMKQKLATFLHIINARNGQGVKVKGKVYFELVKERFRAFLEQGILVREKQPSLYVYELKGEDRRFLGLICATSSEDYRSNIIRRHEDTMARRELLFARFLAGVRFNAEPVLIMYPDNKEVTALLQNECRKPPLYDFSTPDGYVHRLWRISEATGIRRLQTLFGQIDTLYIADGHHRSASSNLMAMKAEAANPGNSGKEAYNFFMSLLLPESAIRISTYNRMVTDLYGHSEDSFLARINENYKLRQIECHPAHPARKGHFYMYLGRYFYTLELREKSQEFTDVLSGLDSQILYQTILKPLLGIRDLRNDKRLGYSFSENSLQDMKKQIDQGKFAVGFGMVPVSIHDLKAIADAGLVMPPKSTYIEPKLRSGLTIYEF
jgi:uncharacterized protein (DUF1015 family)